MPKVSTREYRTMPVLTRAMEPAEGAAEPSYKVRGYATTFGEKYVLFEDLDGDPVYEVIDAGAFAEADMDDVIMQFDHAGMVFARTRNGSLQVGTDEHGLWIEADLGLTEESRKLYDAIDKGLIDRMSFCFTIEEERFDKATKTSTIYRIGKLYDVSAVSIPANPGTEIAPERMKRMDGEIQEARAERLAEDIRRRKIKILRAKSKAVKAM